MTGPAAAGCPDCAHDAGDAADVVAPTTGGPVDYTDILPPGCRCHIREDIDRGEVRIPPPDGCPLPHHQPNRPLSETMP